MRIPGEKQAKSHRPSIAHKRERAAALVAGGESVAKAAKALGADRDKLGQWLRTEVGQEALDRYKREHAASMVPTIDAGRELLKAGAYASVIALLDTVRTCKGLARIKAAEAILDRVGMPKVQRVEGTVATALDLTKLDDSELDVLTEIMAKAGGA